MPVSSLSNREARALLRRLQRCSRRLQQPIDRVTWSRPAEQVALHLAAARETQQYALLLGLHAFHDNSHSQRSSQRHDGLDDDPGIAGLIEGGCEAAVDLDLVKWKLLQIAETRIPRPEIVQRQAHAQRAQIFEPCGGLSRLLDQYALGHFKHEASRLQSCVAQD